MKHSILCFFFVVAFFITQAMSAELKPSKNGDQFISVVFRYDDYSSRSNTDLELSIINAFRINGASFTVAVTPYISASSVYAISQSDVIPLTSRKSKILLKAHGEGIVDVALHGYSHKTISTEKLSEFEGLDSNTQRERLAKGKQFLERVIDNPVTTFVPPWNSYDLNTLRALEELGFLTISAGKTGEAAVESKLNFLPATCTLFELREAIKTARGSGERRPIIVVLFHGHDFQENDQRRGPMSSQEFFDLLAWLKSQDDVRLLSVGQATQVIGNLSSHRFLLNKRYSLASQLLPPFLREPMMFYGESPRIANILIPTIFFYSCIMLATTILAFIIGMRLWPKIHSFSMFLKYGALVVCLISSTCVFLDLHVGSRGMTFVSSISGIATGYFILALYKQKRTNGNMTTGRSSLNP